MKKKIVIITAAVLAVILPALAVVMTAFAAPAQFDNLFTAAVVDKLDALSEMTGEKVIVIGGSSSPFGLRSDLLEKELDMQVVNFGVYASLGTKLMLDLSRDYIGEGDIVVLSPEVDAQTYSLYFSGYDTLQGLDGRFEYLSGVKSENYGAVAGALWRFASSKLSYIVKGEKPDPSGIYNRSSFNEYGDISYVRPYNMMALGYDPDTVISFDYDTVVSRDFVDYLIEYANYCRKKGAEVYFTFAPVNSLSLAEGTTQRDMYEFYQRLCDDFTETNGDEKTELIKVISTPNTYVIDSAYFYDTNLHLNDAGAVLRTARLAQDMKRAMGLAPSVSIEIPKAPEKPSASAGEEWITEGQTDPELFELRDDGDTYSIIGAKDGAYALEEIIVPTYYNGKRITFISKDAFLGCSSVKKITIPVGITQIAGGAFNGCSSLAGIYLLEESSDKLNVGADLFAGAPSGCLIYIVNADISDFNNHYYWSQYADRMREVK